VCKSNDCNHGKESPLKRRSPRIVVPYERSLAFKFPEIAKEYVGDLDTKTILPGKKNKFQWSCLVCSHVWTACVTQRTSSQKSGCPKCAEHKRAVTRSTAPFEKSIAFKYPEILAEYRGDKDPKTIYPTSEQVFRWQCNACQNYYMSKARARTKAKIGCPDCSRKNFGATQTIAPKSKSLAVKNPELLAEYRGSRDPETIFASSGKKYPWECSVCAHKWEASCDNRTKAGRGCPECGKKKRAISKANAPFEKSFAFRFPELLKEYRGEKDPGTINPGSEVKFLWECSKCSKMWKAAVNHRTGRGSGCPDCAPKKISEIKLNAPYKKSLAFKCPDLTKEYRGSRDPKTVFYASAEKVAWECSKCSNRWEAVVSSRSSGPRCGCPRCAPLGYDQSKPSLFYLISRTGQTKFGIMNIGSGRLRRHSVRGGWKLIDSVEMSGDNARSMETAIKRALRSMGVPMGKDAFRDFHDGYSETFQEVDLLVRSIRELCQVTGVTLEAFLAA